MFSKVQSPCVFLEHLCLVQMGFGVSALDDGSMRRTLQVGHARLLVVAYVEHEHGWSAQLILRALIQWITHLSGRTVPHRAQGMRSVLGSPMRRNSLSKTITAELPFCVRQSVLHSVVHGWWWNLLRVPVKPGTCVDSATAFHRDGGPAGVHSRTFSFERRLKILFPSCRLSRGCFCIRETIRHVLVAI